MFKNKERIIVILILIVIGVSYRLLPHPANFTPIAAISLFSGFYFRRCFILVPFLIMFISDFFIGFYDWKLMAVVYSSLLMVSLMGILMRKNKSVLALIGCSLTGSILFFVLTNGAVWMFGSWYPHNFQGLADCYLMAIPFFKNTLAGDLFYASAIFGCYEILVQPKEQLRFLFAKPIIKLN